jgi:serine/threonine protein kinase/tetratricopeptide (TPR) repeat protein
MIERWRQGERPLTEDFLISHPELWEHPAAAADLIYEELCLREEYGPETSMEEVLLRFPQWRPQLEVLFDCQRLLGPRRRPPQFPTTGEFLGDFLLLAELGGGVHGRVFLASQLSLGDRPVVLKLTACEALTVGEAHEHLSLARLQHTYIVPLYSVQDYPARRLRALCMPYFGGATLARLLRTMRPLPPVQRTGQGLLDALDRVEAPGRVEVHTMGPARQILAGSSYVQAVCWLGACLADALHYAHERGLVHLDLKPSNVLLAADGQPMLLDFHLAREPLQPGGGKPAWLGGTVGYMSPEQQAALLAIEQGRKVTRPVDGRSDIYSLGVVLYEALSGCEQGNRPSQIKEAGSLVAAGGKVKPLHLCNPQVSVGLSDVIGKCLAADPSDRYPHMAALASDLRRHLAHLPLAGVRNRSLLERWQKWRRRRPHRVATGMMMLAVLLAASAVAIGAVNQFFQRDKADELACRLHRAEQVRTAAGRDTAAQELHRLAERVRFLYGIAGQASQPDAASRQAGKPDLRTESLSALEAPSRALWEDRFRIVEHLSRGGTAGLEPHVREDLLDLAIFWADLQEHLAAPDDKTVAHQKTLTTLDEAETLLGPSSVLDQERKLRGAPNLRLSQIPKPTPPTVGRESVIPQESAATAWEHCALGRAFLRSGDLQRALAELERAVLLHPQGLWPNFYYGLCAYRLHRYPDAIAAYSVCIGAASEPAGCFYNRALAYEALGRIEQALQDYDQALRLDPGLANAALNRGMLYYRQKRYAAAIADLEHARDLGADPAVVSFDLALANWARGEYAAALDNLNQTLRYNPHHAEARKLKDRLQAR